MRQMVLPHMFYLLRPDAYNTGDTESDYFLFKIFKVIGSEEIAERYLKAVAKLFYCNNPRIRAFSVKNALYF